MKFVIIDPSKAKVEKVEAKSLYDAFKFVDLKPGEVDFGTLVIDPKTGRGLSIVVFEFSMFLPVEAARYFSIGNRLFAGGAVLFEFNEHGDTVDYEGLMPPVRFYRDARQVEIAIQGGAVIRPEMSVNGVVTWRWPDAKPR